jgi:hypothetical protein
MSPDNVNRCPPPVKERPPVVALNLNAAIGRTSPSADQVRTMIRKRDVSQKRSGCSMVSAPAILPSFSACGLAYDAFCRERISY